MGEGYRCSMHLTAAMAVMLLQAIFVPIVHKTFIKSGVGSKTVNKTFIVRQLLFS
jgi:hypothetical protein